VLGATPAGARRIRALHLRRRVEILLDVMLRIDHGRLTAVRDQLRRMGEAIEVELPEHLSAECRVVLSPES
jgi:hypothetical protein